MLAIACHGGPNRSLLVQSDPHINKTIQPPRPSEPLENHPTKSKWKTIVDGAINNEMEDTWREGIKNKNTLKYINLNRVEVGHLHPVWATVRHSVYARRRAEVKCRLLTATFTLLSNEAVFNQYNVDPTCLQKCPRKPPTLSG